MGYRMMDCARTETHIPLHHDRLPVLRLRLATGIITGLHDDAVRICGHIVLLLPWSITCPEVGRGVVQPPPPGPVVRVHFWLAPPEEVLIYIWISNVGEYTSR
jgi:hypothetical protein